MSDITNLINSLSEHSNLVSYVSLVLSLCTFFLTRYTNRRFAKNEFIKKQISEVAQLTSYLNGEMFEVRFSSFSDGGSSSSTYTINIFELRNLETVKISRHFTDAPVAFSRTSNQILDLRNYITNPFIPKSIANELDKFYSFRNGDIIAEQVEGENIIVIHSKVFEETIFQRLDEPQARLREPSAFAFESLENLIECSKLLQKAIVTWLKKYKVDQINIRSYIWAEE